MADPVVTTPPPTPANPLEGIAAMLKTEIAGALAPLQGDINALKEKAAKPVYPAGANPNNLFSPVIGPIGKDTPSYSIMKAARYASGIGTLEDCKYENDVNLKLQKMYRDAGGYTPTVSGRYSGFCVPYSTRHMPQNLSVEADQVILECKQSQAAQWAKFDPDEAAHIVKHMIPQHQQEHWTKALGTISDTAGGAVVGFPTLGELIDLQRNLEVFATAGATEIGLPANGMINYPKLTGGSTSFWVGEGKAITESQPVTGSLELKAKKAAILVYLNNEILRFASPTIEGMTRLDMARQSALLIDTAMLQGTGGTQIKGLITYPQYATSDIWVQGTDKVLTYAVTANKFQPQDVYGMAGKLPDAAQRMPLKFVMRFDLFGKVRGRRADAVVAADAAGTFVFNITRSQSDKIPFELDGNPVVASSQVSRTRGNGSQTYVILGAFPDWITARFGIMEFLTFNGTDTAVVNDQTILRGIQMIDAGMRHAASFCFADEINVS